MSRALIMCFLVLFAGSLQAKTYFCDNTNNYIQTGNTMEQVANACGEPSSQRTYQEHDKAVTATSTQWLYYQYEPSKQPRPRPQPSDGRPADLNPAMPRARRHAVLLNFKDNKLAQILIGSDSVPAVALCGGIVNVGETANDIRLVCGRPAKVSTHEEQVPGPVVEKTEWTYDKGEYFPSVKMIFVDNKLTAIK